MFHKAVDHFIITGYTVEIVKGRRAHLDYIFASLPSYGGIRLLISTFMFKILKFLIFFIYIKLNSKEESMSEILWNVCV